MVAIELPVPGENKALIPRDKHIPEGRLGRPLPVIGVRKRTQEILTDQSTRLCPELCDDLSNPLGRFVVQPLQGSSYDGSLKEFGRAGVHSPITRLRICGPG